MEEHLTKGKVRENTRFIPKISLLLLCIMEDGSEGVEACMEQIGTTQQPQKSLPCVVAFTCCSQVVLCFCLGCPMNLLLSTQFL